MHKIIYTYLFYICSAEFLRNSSLCFHFDVCHTFEEEAAGAGAAAALPAAGASAVPREGLPAAAWVDPPKSGAAL